MKRRYVYIAILLAGASLMTGMVGCQKREETMLHIGEPVTAPHEWPTEPSTEAPTESPTEAPTEKPTEAPTEPPTEPEPEIEIAIKARDTMLEGTPVEFAMGYSNQHAFPESQNKLNYVTVPIQNGTEIDNEREISVQVVRSLEEFQEAISIFREEVRLPEYDKYDERYFQNHVLLVLYGGYSAGQGWSVATIKKDGAELYLGLSSEVMIPNTDYSYPFVAYFRQQAIEISRNDLDGVDTISVFAKARNTK